MPTLTATTTTVRRTGRVATTALWVGQVLLAASFVMASIGKVTLDPFVVGSFDRMGISATGTLVIGCLEIAAVVGLMIPRLAGFTAICALALMIGAVTFTLVYLPADLALFPAVLGVVAALVAYGRRDRTAALVATVRTIVER